MKILIAEDEKAMSDALAAVLKHFGYEVDAVYDGLAATEKARENSYSCIIFDIMMPKIDGIEALKRIRDSGDMTPVIMLTARDELPDKIAGFRAGADDYLTKPFDMQELLARITALLRRARLPAFGGWRGGFGVLGGRKMQTCGVAGRAGRRVRKHGGRKKG